ncbi:MAG: hypothetical protein Q4C87_02370 [Actinomycetaceae bacterium]|nr:hypothetical protein [Actinomycetaceae bacterium]
MSTLSLSGSADHLGGMQSPSVKPLNHMGIAALTILILQRIARPLASFALPDDLGIAAFAGYASIFLTLIALGCGIVGLMRKETRAYWTAIAATAIAIWWPLSQVYFYLINRMAWAAM